MRAIESPRIAALAALAVYAAGGLVALSFPVHHDNGWLLYVASRMRDGASLYSDIVEVNPPLIVWLTALAERAARGVGAWPPTFYRLGVLAIGALSLVCCSRLLQARGAMAQLLIVVLAYLFTAAPGFEFGQREHLAILLVMPYLLLASRPAGGDGPRRATRILLGVMAGVGFALKPFFAFAWVLPEALLAARRGTRSLARTESLALLLTVAAYGMAVLVFARDYFAVVRLAAPYTGFSATAPWLLLTMPVAQFALLAGGAWLIARPHVPRRDLGDVLSLALLGFVIGVLAQQKGWDYHWIPSTTLAWMLLAVVAARSIRALPRPWRRRASRVAPLAAAVLALWLTTVVAERGRTLRTEMAGNAYLMRPMMQLMADHARGGPIAALSTNMQAAFPLVNYADVEWGLRFNALWVLPGVYQPNPPGRPFPYREPETMPAAERYMFDAVIQDLIRSRPTVLIVDLTAPGYVLHGFDYLAYFGQDPRFAQLLADYHEGPPVRRFRILIRRR